MFVLPSTFRVVSKHVSLFAMYLCSTRILISARILHIINNFPINNFILLRIFYNKTIHKLVLKSNSRKILDWAPLGSVYPYTVRETRIPGEAPLVLNQTSILKSYRLFSLERIWDQWIRKIVMI